MSRRVAGPSTGVFTILIYSGERHWTAPRSFQEAVEPSIPARYIPKFDDYAIILWTSTRNAWLARPVPLQRCCTLSDSTGTKSLAI